MGDIDFLKSNNAAIFVCTTINYSDVFAKVWRTEMCSATSGQDIAEKLPSAGQDLQLKNVLWEHVHQYAN